MRPPAWAWGWWGPKDRVWGPVLVTLAALLVAVFVGALIWALT